MPIALMFFIAILAETNRPPFDLPEAESELVAGFMTEHGASIFVFFFLGEYSSLILMSSFMSIFFLGGHHCPDIHRLILDPFLFLFYYFEAEFSPYFYQVFDSFSYQISLGLNPDITSIKNNKLFTVPLNYEENDYFTKFSSKDTILESLNLLIDKIQGSYILGFKIIVVVFFYI